MEPKPRESFEQFKLRFYKDRLRMLVIHKNIMLAHRAGANKITLGFLDASEEASDQDIATLKRKIYMLSAPRSAVGGLSALDIANAKLVPIRNFIKVPPHKKVKCLFHDDKEASMHIYDCRYYCFSCGANDSTIGIIMKLRSCTFIEAVRFLLNK